MVSIIKTCRRFEWPVDFLSVISDRPCEGIVKARGLGVNGELLDREKLGKRFSKLNCLVKSQPTILTLLF